MTASSYTRENANSDIMARLEELLDSYFASSTAAEKGFPTVRYCADEVGNPCRVIKPIDREECQSGATRHPGDLRD